MKTNENTLCWDCMNTKNKFVNWLKGATFTDTKPSGFNQHDWQMVGIGYSIEMYVYVPKGKRWDLSRALIYTCSWNISEDRDL